ncbi:MAG TPA: ATP-binding protein, partial [Segetibacter sp.]
DKQTGLFRHLQHKETDKTSLSHNNIVDMLEDQSGCIWVATLNGLNQYDQEKKVFKTYRTEDGLPDNKVSALLEDSNGNLWLGTTNGLSNMIISRMDNSTVSLRFKNYNEADGLQGREFNENAALRTGKGELVFGGPNGFNIFLPLAIKENNKVPDLILTDLQVFNKSIKIGDSFDGTITLPQSISYAREINLTHNQNVFTIEFAALRFLNPREIKYAYKLEGFSDEWLTVDGRNRNATFTNLDAGSYIFKVKAFIENGKESARPLMLKINVLPPFWLTNQAFFLYAVLFVIALMAARHLVLKQAELRFAVERERQEVDRLHELDLMKIKFFTNVSHEFRTPLALIISPVERLLKQSNQLVDKEQIQIIYRNARRLLNLVNQLLDFRKLEEHEFRLNKVSGDIIYFIKDVTSSFTDVATNKKIGFSFNSTHDMLFTDFDHDKIERILFNLLSNAFKFTPAGGAVNVLLEVKDDDQQKLLQIKVIDTGIGIAKDKLERIFDRFFQSDIPGSIINQGSGIGLSITKEFVKLHGGTITVESEADK